MPPRHEKRLTARRLPWNENLVVLGLLIAVLFVTASAWDEKDARAELERWRDRQDAALKWAVERYGSHEYFASDRHCAVPLKGERLVMQLAAPHDRGSGYRCTYYVLLQRPDRLEQASVTWSRGFAESVELPLSEALR